MEAELVALAGSGATAVVELLASEAFERVRRPLGRFLRRWSRRGPDEGQLLADSREALGAREAGDEAALAEVRDRWRERLGGIFRDDPGAAAELAGLLAELAPDAARGFVTLVGGGTNHGPAFQGSQIHGGIVFNVPAAPPPASEGWVRPDQVPAVTGTFSNRRAELAALDEVFGGAPGGPVGVGVLEGLPGAGKSALGRRWAELARERFPDGQLYVDFADLRDRTAPSGPAGGDVSEALAMCLKSLPGGDRDIPDSVAARTNLFRSRSADLRILVVLDDVTQASQVRALIPKGAGSAVLATSRGRLAELFLDGGARPVPVGPLDGHGGLELLRDRCRGSRDGLVDAEPEAAERLVKLCGGLPVALQVAAARLVTDEDLGLRELAGELEEEAGRLAGLALFGGESAVSVALGPAYRLLPPEPARLYRLLGWLPAGTFDAGVAAAAAGVDTATAKRLLGVLVRASLIEAVRGGRYRVHDLVRLHARERAVEEEPGTAYAELTERVARHYLALAAFADRAVRRDRLRVARLDELLGGAEDPFAAPGGPAPLEWLDTERAAILAVLRAATAHELYTLVWPLAESFTVLFLHHRYLGAWKESLELGAEAAARAAALADTAQDVALATAAEARLRSLLSRPLLDLHDTAEAGRELRRASALAQVAGDVHVHASVLEFLGRYESRFELSGAVDTLRRCLELNEQVGDPRGAALARFFLGCAQDAEDDHAGAMATLLGARAAFAALAEPDPRMAARVGAAIGAVHCRMGQSDDALRELRAAVQQLEQLDARHYAAGALENLANVTELRDGRTEEARDYLLRARAIYTEVGNERSQTLDLRLEGFPD